MLQAGSNVTPVISNVASLGPLTNVSSIVTTNGAGGSGNPVSSQTPFRTAGACRGIIPPLCVSLPSGAIVTCCGAAPVTITDPKKSG
jgi:hypothetical protein